MAEIVRGLKAGIVAGIFCGVIYGIWLGLLIAPFGYISAGILFGIFAGIYIGIIPGIFLGVIYAATYTRLPGNSSIGKGVVLALTAWILLRLGPKWLVPLWQPSPIALTSLGTGGFILFETPFLLTVILFGFLLGRSWKNQEINLSSTESKKVSLRKRNPVLYWGSVACVGMVAFFLVLELFTPPYHLRVGPSVSITIASASDSSITLSHRGGDNITLSEIKISKNGREVSTISNLKGNFNVTENLTLEFFPGTWAKDDRIALVHVPTAKQIFQANVS